MKIVELTDHIVFKPFCIKIETEFEHHQLIKICERIYEDCDEYEEVSYDTCEIANRMKEILLNFDSLCKLPKGEVIK